MTYVNRTREALNRYGLRALLVGAYRAVCCWPKGRSVLTALRLRLICGAKIAEDVQIGRDFALNVPSGKLSIERGTLIGDRCVCEIAANPVATLIIGSACFLAHDVHLAVSMRVTVGNNVRIGEFTSIRDASHKYRDKNLKINEQGDDVGTIEIGDDVWIGRGSLVLGTAGGTAIGRGAVIGANAVVKGIIPEYAIAVGIPAKVIGYRQ
jgi:carbonic anhydrase/acetyltransferase-like protein (isoleucine patch superfamily)